MNRLLNRALVVSTCALSVGLAHANADLIKFGERFKPGLYQYTLTPDTTSMSGMPAGMKLPPQTFTHCVTQQEIEQGRQFQSGKGQQGGMQCTPSDVKVSGNTASFKQNCKGNGMEMKGDVVATINGNVTVSKTTMDMNMGGKMIKSSSTMEMKYMGACK